MGPFGLITLDASIKHPFRASLRTSEGSWNFSSKSESWTELIINYYSKKVFIAALSVSTISKSSVIGLTIAILHADFSSTLFAISCPA